MKAVLVVALLGLVGLWGWALAWPKPVEPLPEAYRGAWSVFVLKPGAGGAVPNPLPAGERRLLLREDGTYLDSVLLPGGVEMLRQEGLAYADGDVLTLETVSENGKSVDEKVAALLRRADGLDAEGSREDAERVRGDAAGFRAFLVQRFRAEWRKDERGSPFLALVHMDVQGHEMHLRRLAE